ncbi:MFS transporter [Cognataquiflexum aquatile]|uniref:MFS transporter n=1 Tax=Cognataquiflexum aquatile TaxID=2249427 RepID=UPI000DEBEE50|nr:MFS transporter [Cognataquiflexum aquatile]
MKKEILSRNVIVLSLVSLFTDVASEMLYPVMPIYLKTIGFSIILIGVLEGFAEGLAGLSKGYFGKMSDNTGKRLPFVRFGYALSALSKPLLVLFAFPVWVFFARTLDRLGKGVRTGARDALLSDEATPETKGRVFGFHRAMDTTGAVAGPLLALIYLSIWPEDYKMLFILAFFPGILAIGLTFLIKEKKVIEAKPVKKIRILEFVKYWKESPAAYKKLVAGLLFFTLFNSSDVFLLLKVKEAGYGDTFVIGIYVFYNLVYAVFSYPLGSLADKWGMKKVFTSGLLVFAFVYIGFAFFEHQWMFVFLFFFYGIFAASTEGIAKAWISNISDPSQTATAIGTFTAFQSVGILFASSFAGLIWYSFGAEYVFLFGGIAAFVVVVYLQLVKEKRSF